jgi:hypothetical protein
MQELRLVGWVLRKGVSSVSACKGVIEFFKEEARKPGGRHVITNGMRHMCPVDPSRCTDIRIMTVMEDAKRNLSSMLPNDYFNGEDVVLKEVQIIMNQEGSLDQSRHSDSFHNNYVMTVLLQTGYSDSRKGTLTLMSPQQYMDMYKLSEELKCKHNITQEEWESILVETIEFIKIGLSKEGTSTDTGMFSSTEKERKVWVDLIFGCGLCSLEGNPISEGDMGHTRRRNEDNVGDAVVFYSNRVHQGSGTHSQCEDANGNVMLDDDFHGRLVIYFAFGSRESSVKESSAAFLQDTSLVIYAEDLLGKLQLSPKSCRVEKRSMNGPSGPRSTPNETVKQHYSKYKSIYPVRGDGNCLFGSVWQGLIWLLCHIRDTMELARYETCPVYMKIVDVIASSESGVRGGVHKLRTYACDVLETEFLSDVQLPRDARIMILNTSLSGFRDKVITCLENISKNIVEGERIVTKGDIYLY